MKAILKIALSIGVSFAVLGLMLHLFAGGLSPENRPSILAVLKSTTFALLGVYFLLYLVQLIARAIRYRVLIAAAGETNMPNLWQMSLVTGVRNMFVDMLPARVGELTYVAMLNRGYKVGADACLSSLTVAIAFDFLALLVVVIALFAKQLLTGTMEGWMYGALISAFVISIVAFIGLFFIAPKVVRWVDVHSGHSLLRYRWVQAIVSLGRKVSDALDATRASGQMLYVLFLSVLIRVLKYGGFYLLFKAVVVPSFEALANLPIQQTISALIGGELAASLPVPAFMSFGVYEAGGTAVLTALGLDKGDSLIAMLSVHIWSQLFDYILGGLCLLLFVWLYKVAASNGATNSDEVSEGDAMLGEFSRYLKIVGVGLVLLFGTGLLAKEYRASKKMGALSAPPVGEDVSSQFADRLHSTTIELEGVKGFVVWSSNRNGNHDILRMDLPSREITSITNHPHTEFYPRVSPDGERIIFSRSHQPWVSQRNWEAWDVYVKDLRSGKESLVAKNANFAKWSDDNEVTYLQNGYSVVKKGLGLFGKEEIVYQSGLNNNIPAGAKVSTPDYNPKTGQVVFTGKQSELGMRSGFWGTAIYGEDGKHQGLNNGCQIFFSTDGSYLYQVGKGGKFDKKGNQFLRIDPETYEARTMIDLDDDYSHIYFPKDSNDGAYVILGASAGGHEHDAADYELFLWKVGSNPHYATRLTFHSGNDNWPDVYIKP